MTPLFRFDVQRLALVRRGNAQNFSGKSVLADDARHAVPQEKLHAEFSRARFQRTHQRGAVASVRRVGADLARPMDGLRAHHVLRAAVGSVRGNLGKFHAVGQQKIEGRHAFIAECANNFAVAEPVVVPRDQVLVHGVRRIHDAVFLLQARSSAQGDVSAAFDSVSADVVILLDDDYLGAVLRGFDRRGYPRSTGAYHDDVRAEVPVPRSARRRMFPSRQFRRGRLRRFPRRPF